MSNKDVGELGRINEYGDSLHQRMTIHTREQVIAGPNDISFAEAVGVVASGGALIAPDFAEKISRVSDFDVFTDKVVEEARSAHHVGFGRLVGRKSSNPGKFGHVLTVAMKPFFDPKDAVTEVYGYWKLQELGVETYNPAAIFPTKDGSASIVLSEKRNNLMSLDRDDWVYGRQVHTEAEYEIAARNTQTVKDISATMAWLHANGVFVPDGQIKNYAITDYGKVGVIDTENLTVRPLHDLDTVQLALQDIDKLFRSLVTNDREGKMFGVGMLAGMSVDKLQSCFKELILDPYCDFLEEAYYEGKLDALQAQILLDGINYEFEHNSIDSFKALAA